MFVGTIHAYCLNLLQQAPVYKFLKYSVLTEVQQRLFIDRNSTKSGLTAVPLLAGDTLRRYLDSALYQQILGILGEGEVDLSKVPAAVRTAAGEYWRLCEEDKHLDYTNMIRLAVGELCRNDQLRTTLAGTLRAGGEGGRRHLDRRHRSGGDHQGTARAGPVQAACDEHRAEMPGHGRREPDSPRCEPLQTLAGFVERRAARWREWIVVDA
jgi:hypothetical protein